MKKFIALLLVLVFCMGLCACGAKQDGEKTVEDKVASAVESRITVEITLGYDTTGVPNVTTYVKSNGNNTYTVTGKVTVKDKYGDSYTGKYDAEVTYNPSSDTCDVDLNLGKLYKN